MVLVVSLSNTWIFSTSIANFTVSPGLAVVRGSTLAVIGKSARSKYRKTSAPRSSYTLILASNTAPAGRVLIVTSESYTSSGLIPKVTVFPSYHPSISFFAFAGGSGIECPAHSSVTFSPSFLTVASRKFI